MSMPARSPGIKWAKTLKKSCLKQSCKMFGQLFLYLETKEKLMKKLLFIFLGLASFIVN